MGYKKWCVSEFDKQLAKSLAEECQVDPIVALIASSRGYTDPMDLEQFLSDEPMFTDPKETADIVLAADIINAAIEKETTKRVEENGIDKLLRFLMNVIPGPFIKFVINTLMWMDKHSIMPKKVVELSPFHTSFFITNLKSLGINHVFHHTYNFGTTGLFFAMGKEKKIPVIKCDKIAYEKHMGWGLVSDERFCDGLYFAMSLRQMRKIMRNPVVLETRREKKNEDVD